MPSGVQLKEQIDAKMNEIKQLVSSLPEDKAAEAPAPGEWCAKEVLSHLAGSDEHGSVERFQRMLQEDTPFLDIVPGISYYEARGSKSKQELLAEVEKQFGEIGSFLGGLNEEQLGRKAHVPLFKDSPIGEYPTLEQLAMGLIHFHVADHVNQLQNLCR